jgi:hypothetical protein
VALEASWAVPGATPSKDPRVTPWTPAARVSTMGMSTPLSLVVSCDQGVKPSASCRATETTCPLGTDSVRPESASLKATVCAVGLNAGVEAAGGGFEAAGEPGPEDGRPTELQA